MLSFRQAGRDGAVEFHLDLSFLQMPDSIYVTSLQFLGKWLTPGRKQGLASRGPLSLCGPLFKQAAVCFPTQLCLACDAGLEDVFGTAESLCMQASLGTLEQALPSVSLGERPPSSLFSFLALFTSVQKYTLDTVEGWRVPDGFWSL